MTTETIQRFLSFAFFSAVNKIIWGIVFLMPQDSFSLAISYKYMAQVMTEFDWGVLLLTIGIFHVYAVFANRLYFRIALQCMSVGVWLFIAVTLALSNPLGTGLYTYGLSTVLDFLAVIYLLHYKGGNYT